MLTMQRAARNRKREERKIERKREKYGASKLHSRKPIARLSNLNPEQVLRAAVAAATAFCRRRRDARFPRSDGERLGHDVIVSWMVRNSESSRPRFYLKGYIVLPNARLTVFY